MSNSFSCSNDFIALILYFDLLDGLIDKYNKNLIGEGFYNKFKKMDTSTPYFKILAQLYRILIIYRNAFIHDKSRIKDFLSVEYEVERRGKKQRYTLAMNARIAGIIKTLANLLYRVSVTNSLYDECILCGLYTVLKSREDFRIFDGTGNTLADIKSQYCFYNPIRYWYETVFYPLSNTRFQVVTKAPLENLANTYADSGIDYRIAYQGKRYRIPKEMLDADHAIVIDRLPLWEEK